MPPSTSPTQTRQERHVFLIGYRGSGKTSVGKLLADQLGLRFVDTDQLIVQRIEGSITDYFSDHGEPAFRKLETEVIAEVCQMPQPAVVSLGGGAPITPANRDLLKQGTVAYLQASAAVLWHRISQDHQSAQQRPDLTDLGGRQEVSAMLEKRHPTYLQCADFTIDTMNKSIGEIAEQIALSLAR